MNLKIKGMDKKYLLKVLQTFLVVLLCLFVFFGCMCFALLQCNPLLWNMGSRILLSIVVILGCLVSFVAPEC